jgi:LacI family transcriptional regulator
LAQQKILVEGPICKEHGPFFPMPKQNPSVDIPERPPIDLPVTLEDLGKILGLSKRAVSQALHDRPGTVKVSAKTKERVVALAKSMGYRPNTAAKSLTTGRTGMYGIFASSGKMHIQAVHQSMALEIFRRYDISPIVISGATTSAEDMEFSISALINARVDGVLLLQQGAQFLERHLAELRRYGMSVVQVGSSEPAGEISHYAIDWSKAYAPALDHLLEQGYRRIGGLVRNDETLRAREGGKSSSGRRTRAAMLEAIHAARNRGQSFDFRFFDYATDDPSPVDIHPLYRAGYEGMKEIIRRGEVPEALMVQVDGDAFGAMRACQEEGVKIPQDMAITGFSNEPACSGTYLPLTSIEEPFEQMCEDAIQELVVATKGGTQTARQRVLFPCHLVARASSLRPA